MSNETATRTARRTIYRSTTHRLTDGMREFLDRHPIAILATRDADGRIHAVPASYLFEDGRFYVATSSFSRKARNVAARPEATVTVDDRDLPEWVSASGSAELLHGQASREVNDRLYHRVYTDLGLAAVSAFLHCTEDVTIAVTPRTWRSWDIGSTFFAALADAGVPLHDAESWFRP